MEKIGSNESIESLPMNVRTISAEDLIERIYKGNSTPQDERFLPLDQGGVFRYFWISDLNGIGRTEGKFFSVVEVGEKIVGLAELEQQTDNPQNLWIQFISVDPEFQDQGYASKLMEEVFRFAKENNKSLETSLYSKDGYLKLKPKMKELAEKFGVQLVEINEE
jgi:ribosomal protein S18 acetylase RimI-like enzyme